MKKLNQYIPTLIIVLLAFSCEQDFKTFTNDPCDGSDPSIICHPQPEVACPDGASAGAIDLTKFVTIGNSLVAGYQAGAFFTEGQNNSLGKILAKQFECVGGSSTFNQPDINSVNGFNSTFSDPGNGIILGRLILFDAGDGPLPTPAGYPGLPAPYNTADLPGPFTGNKAELNNFAVPGIILGQALTPLTGGPASSNPAYNPYYARFASNPGSSTILGDAIAAQGSFYLFWLGINDVLGYAITGASGAIPLTSESDFATQYNGALGTILGTLPTAKGVAGNIPDVTIFPYFKTVTWDAIEFDPNDPVDVGTVNLLNGAFAGFDAALDGLVGYGQLSPSDAAIRKVSYALGKNPVLINDEDLEDLGPKFDLLLGAGAITAEQRAALALYEQARPLNNKERVAFPAALILGTLANSGDPTSIYGVVVPMADEYILTENEIDLIRQRTDTFNAIISAAIAGSNDRMALADIKTIYSNFETQGIDIRNGVALTPGFIPPTGTFSEDGVHPNSRGYAYLANFIIDAINTKFGASIPHADVGDYLATGLPLP
jgi:hypothetical protein